MFAVGRANATIASNRLIRQGIRSTSQIPLARPVDGPPATATNRVQTAGRRFWKTVEIVDHEEAIFVTLDRRPLKTPEGSIVAIPKTKRLLACLIAHEWENQDTIIKAHALPMTSLAARAIDGLSRDPGRREVREVLLKYYDTDAIRFFDDHPPALVELQERHWTPLLEWTKSTFGVAVNKIETIFPQSETSENKAGFRHILDELDEWQLASMERAVYTSKSFIIALALLYGRLGVEEAALACQVEVNSQIQKWGEVEDTHDVDFHDVRRQLASAACLLVNS